MAALDLAPADEHAHRALPPPAPRRRRHPRVDLPAALDRRPPHRAVDRRQPHRGEGPRRPRVLRGLRLAVVRRDLPAPLRLAHRLRPAPHPDPLAPGVVDPAEGAASPGPPCGTPQHGGRRRPGGGPRAAAHRPSSPPLPRPRPRRHDPVGGEGLRARGGQPRLPRGAHRDPRRGRLGPPARLEGRRHRARGRDPGEHAGPLRHLQPRAVGRRQRPGAVDPHARPARRRVRDRDQGPRAVRRPARLRGHDDLHPRRQRPRAARRPGQRPPRDRRRHRLPPRQRVRTADHRARRPRHRAVLRTHRLPPAGRQLHVRRGREGARGQPQGSSASPGSSCRPASSTARPGRTRSSPTPSTRSSR